MAVNRISNIKIKDRGLFTAIYGNVNEEEYFVDDDLKNYSLSQALYLYLKSEGYNSIVFYDSADNFHSFSQNDLVTFLKLDVPNSTIGKQADDDWEISGPLGKESNTENTSSNPVSDKPVHDTIQAVEIYGSSDRYFRTHLTINLLDYLKLNLPNDEKCVVIIKRPESSQFDNVDDYVNFFSQLNSIYAKNKTKSKTQNKVIVIYGSNNSHALMDNIKILGDYLFTHTYFKDLFFNVDGDKYKIKDATTFQVGFPELKEIRSWVNRKRVLELTDLFNTVPFDKIVLRLTQERKQIKELDSINLTSYISNINTKSAWDLLNELRGIEEIKVQFQKLITSRKKNDERSKKVRTRPHMCFKGSPGTGKTTVAEIFSEILKEENVLELGQLVKVTVGDLVGEYVGATRIKTQTVCDKAKGGVLFIDEAYGLLDNAENGFGKEAIEVLIQFMENNEDSLVILAGYTDKIDKLLKEGNDGFTSRFNKSNHFLFKDYPADVLFEIAKEKLKDFATTNEFLESVKQILTVLLSRKNAQWGNAREVENLIQEIIIEFDNTNDEVLSVNHIPIHYQNLIKQIEGREGTFAGLLKLNELIGLNHMKSSLRGILNSIKADKLRAEHNGTASSVYKLNFVFRGNPGTGKTKVARFLGEILTEIGLLNDSEPIECRREDIIGEYSGHTAPKVKQKFIDAIGRVLFIDEAYAICIGEHDQFGKEAVNAIVGNLTDPSFQGKMAFVIAGYPDDIDEFIQQNQGLNRRFNFFIDFEDFSNEELWQIYKIMVKEHNIIVVEECRDLAVSWFSQFPRIKGFENAGLSERLLGITKSNLDTRIANATAEERKIPEILNTITQIDFPNFNSSSTQEAKPIQLVLLTPPTEEIPVTIVEKPAVEIETTKPPTELEAAKKQLLYDYCIIDTNIWMETRKTKLYQGRIGTLKNIYSKEQKKLVAHGSTYEELKKFADSPTRNEKSNAAYGALKMMKQFHKEKIILIPGLKSIYDADAYADKDIYDFATEEYQKGKSILFITNDNDCNIRVSSSLAGLKGRDPSLANFDVLDMEQISSSVDLIYEKLFKGPLK